MALSENRFENRSKTALNIPEKQFPERLKNDTINTGFERGYYYDDICLYDRKK